MGLVLLGLNHRTAPLDLREQVVYAPEEAVTALRDLREEGQVPQALLISTCNRTELYAFTAKGYPAERLVETIFLNRVNGERREDRNWLYREEDRKAVEHLFRVACGLDSMVLGEQQILGQVKTAYDLAQKADATGTVMHRLATRAFRVGKRARTETRIGEGALSVAYAAVELAEKVFQNLENRGVLVVGAGENAALCIEHLLGRKCSPLFISNRTESRAEDLAREYGGDVVPFDRLADGMVQADIVVSTTGAPDPVISADMVRAAMSRRGDRPMIFMDIAVPRDVHPDVDQVRNVFRFDMDALQGMVDQNLARREDEIPAVERLVDHETENFMKWLQTLAAGPVIKDLHETFERIRSEELKKHGKRFRDDDREQLDTFSRNLVRKFLLGVTMEIKGYRPDNPEHANRLASLRHVFGLGDADDEEEMDLD